MAEQKKKILVVDDDPMVIKLLESILNHEGYEAVVAKDGLEAMMQVKNHHPQLIVLDIMMPELNGYDVCNTLKFDSPYKDTPIILLTSRGQEIDPRIGQMMGIHYLQKPLNRDLFVTKIKELLK